MQYNISVNERKNTLGQEVKWRDVLFELLGGIIVTSYQIEFNKGCVFLAYLSVIAFLFVVLDTIDVICYNLCVKVSARKVLRVIFSTIKLIAIIGLLVAIIITCVQLGEMLQ